MACEMTVLPLPGGPYTNIECVGVDGGAELIENTIADHEVRERLADAVAIDVAACRAAGNRTCTAGTARAAPAPGRRSGCAP